MILNELFQHFFLDFKGKYFEKSTVKVNGVFFTIIK